MRDSEGAPQTVYLVHREGQTTGDGWRIASLDVGSWIPLNAGDRLVALDVRSSNEFVVEVVAVERLGDEVFNRLRHLADLDPAAEPGLASTRTAPRRPGRCCGRCTEADRCIDHVLTGAGVAVAGVLVVLDAPQRGSRDDGPSLCGVVTSSTPLCTRHFWLGALSRGSMLPRARREALPTEPSERAV